MNEAKDTAPIVRAPVRTQGEFGALVRNSRIGRKLTQEQLATRVGKSRRWLQDVERGRVAPTLPAVIAVLACLGYELVAEPSTTSPILDQVFGDLR